MIREIRYTQNPGTDVLTWDVGYVDDSVGTITFSNLRGGEYSVRARLDIDGAKTGFGSVNTTTVNPMTLSAPANFIVSEKYSNSITLQWDQVANAESNVIEVSSDGISYSPLATIDGSLIEYVHTGLTISTTYYYRIKAIGDGTETDYLDSTYSTVSDTTNSTIITLSDDFTGTVIDTAKHTVINQSPGAVTITQNNELLIASTGSLAASLNANRLLAKDPVSNYIFTAAFDINLTLDGTSFQFYAQIINAGLTQFAAVARSGANARLIVLNLAESGSIIYDFVTAIAVDGKKWKIVKDPTSVSFYYWDGAAWVQAGASTSTVFDKNMYYNFTINATTSGSNTLGIDNLFTTDDDYATVTP